MKLQIALKSLLLIALLLMSAWMNYHGAARPRSEGIELASTGIQVGNA